MTGHASGPLRWTMADVAPLARSAAYGRVPAVIRAGDVMRVDPAIDVWDAWPLADRSGAPIAWRGGELWFALAAAAAPDPELRHECARIHHFHRLPLDDPNKRAGDAGNPAGHEDTPRAACSRFVPLGPVLPEGFAPGSREWSGSAVLHPDGDVELAFTASGTPGREPAGFRQRLFSARAMLRPAAQGAAFGTWRDLRELLVARDRFYLSEHDGDGRPGAIKAFRDPFVYFGADGWRHLLFTGSSARAAQACNGVIGIAAAQGQAPYRRLPPLIDASGVCNELERPHVVAHGGLLYLFWCSQSHAFAPGIGAPSGLYGAVASAIEGPWRLLNGHGLVFANPPEQPFQAYAWWVLPDLSVTGFVDYFALDTIRPDNSACDGPAHTKPLGRRYFGGGFAPFVQLVLDGPQAHLAQPRA